MVGDKELLSGGSTRFALGERIACEKHVEYVSGYLGFLRYVILSEERFTANPGGRRFLWSANFTDAIDLPRIRYFLTPSRRQAP